MWLVPLYSLICSVMNMEPIFLQQTKSVNFQLLLHRIKIYILYRFQTRNLFVWSSNGLIRLYE